MLLNLLLELWRCRNQRLRSSSDWQQMGHQHRTSTTGDTYHGQVGRAGSIACVLLGKCGHKRVKASKETSPVFDGSSAIWFEVVVVANMKKWRLPWINTSKYHSLQV